MGDGLKPPKRILVIQLRRIGDVILTTPAVAALKARWPQTPLDFLVEPPGAEALAGNPNIERIHVYKSDGSFGTFGWLRRIRRENYDWVIDFMGNPRSAMLTAFSGAAVRAGPAHVSHRWAYNLRLVQSKTTHYAGQEKIRVLAELGVPGNFPFLPRLYIAGDSRPPGARVALAPASRKETRRWPAASYAEVGRKIGDRTGNEILVFWGPGEKKLAEEVANGIGNGARITTETRSLADAALQLAGCRLLITNCNGTKHLGVALGIPTVTIHGSSDPDSWNPPDPRHLVVRLSPVELPCIGCGLNRCPYELQCMRDLPPERVLRAAMSLLARESRT